MFLLAFYRIEIFPLVLVTKFYILFVIRTVHLPLFCCSEDLLVFLLRYRSVKIVLTCLKYRRVFDPPLSSSGLNPWTPLGAVLPLPRPQLQAHSAVRAPPRSLWTIGASSLSSSPRVWELSMFCLNDWQHFSRSNEYRTSGSAGLKLEQH